MPYDHLEERLEILCAPDDSEPITLQHQVDQIHVLIGDLLSDAGLSLTVTVSSHLLYGTEEDIFDIDAESRAPSDPPTSLSDVGFSYAPQVTLVHDETGSSVSIHGSTVADAFYNAYCCMYSLVSGIPTDRERNSASDAVEEGVVRLSEARLCRAPYQSSTKPKRSGQLSGAKLLRSTINVFQRAHAAWKGLAV